MQEIIRTIPVPQKQFRDLLVRVSDGLKESGRMVIEGAARSQQIFRNIIKDKQFSFN